MIFISFLTIKIIESSLKVKNRVKYKVYQIKIVIVRKRKLALNNIENNNDMDI